VLPERSATVVNHSRNPAWHRPALNQSDLPNSFFDMALRRSSQDLTPRVTQSDGTNMSNALFERSDWTPLSGGVMVLPGG
jgi:hypothetical protein